jgi:hypothetical protein
MGPYRPIVAALLDRAVDDAALLCEARLSMHDAVESHLQARAGPHGRTVGHFVVPASRLTELAETLAHEVPTLNVVLDRHLERAFSAIDGCTDLRIASVDTPVGVNVGKGEMLEELVAWSKLRDGRHDVYCEILGMEPQPSHIDEMVEHVALIREEHQNFGAKIPTAGATSEAIAHAVASCSAHRVPFKATADLARPITSSSNGATSYGFLNLMTAALVAFRDPDAYGTIIAALEEHQAAAFALEDDLLTWQGRNFGAATLAAMRQQLFVAFAGCNPTEPAVHLGELGFLP